MVWDLELIALSREGSFLSGLPSGSLEVGEWPAENPRPPEALNPGPAMAPRGVLSLTKGTRKPDLKWLQPICQSTGQGKAGPL